MRMQCVPGLPSPSPRRPGDEATCYLFPFFFGGGGGGGGGAYLPTKNNEVYINYA